MKIAVRLDDITPDMDWERFMDFKALLDRYGIKPLIGVIPDNQDTSISTGETGHPEFWNFIKELQKEGWVVAMHGWCHIYTTKKGGMFPLNKFSEFAGVSYEQQETMLRMGKSLLKKKGIETKIFMAPAHSYDANTLRALKNTGFTAVTDGFGKNPYRWKSLIFYPISFKLSSTLRKKKGFSTMVVHAGTVSREELPKYEKYFQQEGAVWISFGEYMMQPAGNRMIFGRIKEYFMAKGKYLIAQIRR